MVASGFATPEGVVPMIQTRPFPSMESPDTARPLLNVRFEGETEPSALTFVTTE